MYSFNDSFNLRYEALVNQVGAETAYDVTLTYLESVCEAEGLAAYVQSGTRQIVIMTSDQANEPSLDGHWSPVTEAPCYLGFPPA